MNILTILALLVLVATAIIIFAIWLNKKGITKDENNFFHYNLNKIIFF